MVCESLMTNAVKEKPVIDESDDDVNYVEKFNQMKEYAEDIENKYSRSNDAFGKIS